MKRIGYVLLFVGAATLAAGCGRSPAETAKQFVMAMNAGDMKAAQTLAAKDLAQGMEIRANVAGGWDKVIEKAKADPNSGFGTIDHMDVIQTNKTTSDGKHNYTVVVYTVTSKAGQTSRRQSIRLVEEDGVWKVNDMPNQ